MMKVSLLQYEPSFGEVNLNIEKIQKAAEKSLMDKSEVLVVTGYLTGYPLLDFSRRELLYQAIDEAIIALQKIQNIYIVFLHPIKEEGIHYLAVSVFYNSQLVARVYKTHLGKSEYADLNYFSEKESRRIVEILDHKIAILFSEELEYREEILSIKESVDGIFVFDSQSFYYGLEQDRLSDAKKLTDSFSVPVLSAYPLGTIDEYIFDGFSFALNHLGQLFWHSIPLEENLYQFEFYEDYNALTLKYPSREEKLYSILVFSLRSYLQKNGFKKICLGLSGGIDSALVLVLAADAIGAENCEVILLPSEYTSDLSKDLAFQLANDLQVKHSMIPISPVFDSIKTSLSERFEGLTEDTTEENIQARIRSVLLMALSNKTQALLLCTSNKSEVATGYGTLYGDTCGGFAPIKDLLKTEVYSLSRWLNREKEVIPQGIIDRKPSAELKPNQTDQDSLPVYEVLDQIIDLIMEEVDLNGIIKKGFDAEIVYRIFSLLKINEYKKHQSVIGPKLSKRSFGKEWNYPIVPFPIHY